MVETDCSMRWLLLGPQAGTSEIRARTEVTSHKSPQRLISASPRLPFVLVPGIGHCPQASIFLLSGEGHPLTSPSILPFPLEPLSVCHSAHTVATSSCRPRCISSVSSLNKLLIQRRVVSLFLSALSLKGFYVTRIPEHGCCCTGYTLLVRDTYSLPPALPPPAGCSLGNHI